VEKEAKKAKTTKGDSKTQTQNERKLSNWVKQIGKKVPVIAKLEKKMGMMQGLDPVMETIVSDLNKVTNFDKMNKLNDKWDVKHGADFGNINSASGALDDESDGKISDSDNEASSDDDEPQKKVEKSLKKNASAVNNVKAKLENSLKKA